MLAESEKPTEWIVDKIIPAIGVAVLGGDAMVGKSRFINAVIAARTAKVQGREPKFPFGVRAGRTMLASLEHARISVGRGLITAAKAEEINPESLDMMAMRPTFNILDPMHVEQLIEKCEADATDLLVLDSFRRLGDFEENKSDDIRRIMSILHQLSGENSSCKRCVLVLHHLTKGTGQLRGSTDLKAGTDTQVILKKAGGGMLHMLAEHHDSEPTEATLRVTRDGVWEVASTAAVAPSQEVSAVLEILASNPNSSITTIEIQQQLRTRGHTKDIEEVENLLNDLETGSQVTKLDGKGRKARWSAAKS